jgi:hypothetical protein
MPNLRFTLKAEGDDDAAVDASDFSAFLSSLLTCLKALETETNAQAPVEYKVVDLEIGSAAIELRPVSTGDLDKSASEVARSFSSGFSALQRDEIRRAPFSRGTKEKFLALTKPLRRTTRAIEFKGIDEDIVLSRRVPVRDLPATKTEAVARGSLKGNIDALNVHSRPVFYIYPRSGPTRVRCTFDPHLLDALREAIKRNTTVFGLVEYEAGSAFPAKMYVERVEINPPDTELPTLASFWGAAPNLTGGKSTQDYIDSLRDE